MSKSVLYMSMSLDGHIAGPNDESGNPGGDDFMRLHEWYGFGPDGKTVQESGLGRQFFDEINTTGAVLVGRRTAEQVDHYGGIITAFRSSCQAAGRPARPSRTIRW